MNNKQADWKLKIKKMQKERQLEGIEPPGGVEPPTFWFLMNKSQML